MTFRIATSLVLCFLWTGATHAEVYTFTLTNPPDNAADLPKVKAIGELVDNGFGEGR